MYPSFFVATQFSSADGTSLAGVLGLQRDGKPRPGIVLVPGFTQTSHRKFIVELAELLYRNGWQVLAIDLRGHGESARLSPALITAGWKEAGDVLGAVRFLRGTRQTTSVSVIGFSDGGRSLVKAMAGDGGDAIAAGIAVTAPLAATTPVTPPPAGFTPTASERFFLDFLGAPSEYDYYERAARSYGVDLRAMEARTVADADIVRVRTPLLMLYALDDILWLGHIREGQHDGGSFSLAYRDRVQGHPHVRTVLVDRGNHAGMLYLSDPHWFGSTVLSYLKFWQARDVEYVTAAVPALDVLAEGSVTGQTATYRFVVRNHGAAAVGPVDVTVDLPVGSRLEQCWLGAEGLGRCTATGNRLNWTLPTLPGGKATAGVFGVRIDVSAVGPSRFATIFWLDHPDIQRSGTARQEVSLEKK